MPNKSSPQRGIDFQGPSRKRPSRKKLKKDREIGNASQKAFETPPQKKTPSTHAPNTISGVQAPKEKKPKRQRGDRKGLKITPPKKRTDNLRENPRKGKIRNYQRLAVKGGKIQKKKPGGLCHTLRTKSPAKQKESAGERQIRKSPPRKGGATPPCSTPP